MGSCVRASLVTSTQGPLAMGSRGWRGYFVSFDEESLIDTLSGNGFRRPIPKTIPGQPVDTPGVSPFSANSSLRSHDYLVYTNQSIHR